MKKANILKGAVSGLVGGLVASFVMNEYQALVTKLTEGDKQSEPSGDDPATVKAGQKISEKLFGHELTEREKKAAIRSCIMLWAEFREWFTEHLPRRLPNQAPASDFHSEQPCGRLPTRSWSPSSGFQSPL
jgi:hypothetical protein